LSLPIVVTRAYRFVPIIPRGHTQAFVTTLLTKEHAWLVILSILAPP